MAENTLLTYRGATALYFALGLAFMLGDNVAIGAVFFFLGICLIARTNDTVDNLAHNRPRLVWIPFVAILLISLSIAVVTLLFPLIYR